MTTFRSKYCVLKDNGFGLEIVGHKNIDNFHQTVDPHIFRINADEVLDLPPKVYIKQIFTLNEEQKRLRIFAIIYYLAFQATRATLGFPSTPAVLRTFTWSVFSPSLSRQANISAAGAQCPPLIETSIA